MNQECLSRFSWNQLQCWRLIKHTLYPSCLPVWVQNLILHLFCRTLRRHNMFHVTFNKYTGRWPSTFYKTSTCKTVSTTSNKSTYQRILNTLHPSIIFIHLPPPVSPVLGKHITTLTQKELLRHHTKCSTWRQRQYGISRFLTSQHARWCISIVRKFQ